MSRAITKEEAREMVLEHIRGLVQYWDTESRATTSREKLEGLAFSVLNIFDGTSSLPAFDIAVRPHPDDKAYHEAEGSNYFEDGMVINDDCHLHELFYRPRTEAEGPTT